MSNKLAERIAREIWNYYLDIDSSRTESGEAAIAKGAAIIVKHLPAQQPRFCSVDTCACHCLTLMQLAELMVNHPALQPAQPRAVWDEALGIVATVRNEVRTVAEQLTGEYKKLYDATIQSKLDICGEIIIALETARDASPQPPAWQGIDATIYCEQCGKHVPLLPISTNRDDRNPEPWGDIVCPECRFVIASIATPAEGVYALTVKPSQETHNGQ